MRRTAIKEEFPPSWEGGSGCQPLIQTQGWGDSSQAVGMVK